MTTTSTRTQQIAASVATDKTYADAFVEAEITTTVPFQLREMRKQRGWKQQDVADRMDSNQKTISDFENPNYAKYTLTSLRKLASAFDVALIVRFAPYSDLVEWASTLTHDKLAVPARMRDKRLKRQRKGLEEVTDTTSNSELFVNRPTNTRVVDSTDSTTRHRQLEQVKQPPTVIKFPNASDQAA